MPPKGKAAAKAKGKAAAAPPDVPLLEVPAAPVCLPLPESCQPRCAAERCLLFASEAKSSYKVQARPWSPGDTPDKAASADDWRDAKELERISMPAGGYEEGRLFAFEQSRIQYRMVLLAGPKPNDGLYVANLQSAASDPICTFLDPPLHLRAELRCDSDVVPAVVTLSWRLPNMEWLRLVGTEGSGFDNLRTSSWAAGLMPSKVQVRWRVLQSLPSNDEALFPAELASGSYVTSPPTAMEADFRMDETWQCTYKEALPAAIAVFGVRLGTLYKWSPWSEDSPALSVEVPEPCPRLSAEASGAEAKDSDPYVEISDLTDSEAQALWRPFATEGALRALEYRVSICQLEGPESAVLWEDAVVAGILHVQEPPEKVGFPLRGLRPDQWYQVRVDARYPCVGKRAFSDSKAVSAAFRTPLPVRPPRQPLPLRLDLDEEEPQPAQAEEAEAAEASATAFLWAARPWVSVHVEHFASETYKFQFKEAVLHGGRSDFEGWQEPVVVEAALQPPQRPGPSLRDQESAIVRIGFPKGAPELVALRLADTSSGASPLRWSVTSPPLVTRVAPPLLARCFEGGGALQLLPTDGGGLQLCLRFFLQPRDEEGPGVSRKALPGHRHVSQCQLRLRVKGESKVPGGKSKRFLELPARALPKACLPTSGLQALVVDGEVTPESPEEALVAGLLGWMGLRYELQADLAEASLRELVTGHELLEASLRVGTEHRWSCWSAWSSPQALPLPLPLPPRSGKVSAEATGPTSLRVSWPPFQRLPGISCLEYALRCEPLAIDSDAAQASAPSGGSGASRRERVESLCFLHEPRRPDAQVLASAQFQRLLDQPEMSLARLASCFQDIRLAEAEEEKDLQLQVELTGLLPWTSYGLSVAARYPAGAGLYPHHGQTEGQKKSEALGPLRPLLGPALTVEVETPGGENAPGAPQEVDPGSVSCEASSFLTHPGLRGIFLSIEDRSDYALEYCAAAPAWAHYDAEVGQALRSFQGSWPRRREAGAWKRVSTVHRLQEIPSAAAGELKEASATSLAPSKVIILAVLPAFGQPGPIPDAVRFRLCAVDRGAAHPCRWAGGVSEPLAVAFAPPRRPPRIQRILSDDRWTLSLQIELFQHQPPPTPTCYLGLRTGTEDTEDDSECEEEEAKELLELRRAQLLPALRPESWQETALDSMPWGYGHRLVTMVQARCSLQSSVLPEHRMDLEREVLSSEWQLSAALELGGGPAAGAAGATTFELPALASGLLDGGVYAFQVRVGNGKTWSEWSHTSIPFLFQVPPPIPPTAASLKAQKTVTVEVMSATAARVVWGDFKPAPGLTLLEYEVRATPRQETSGRPLGAKAFPSQALTFQHRYRGGFIEHELLNLLPFTTYTFSVQARYPKVGMRLWSGQQVTEPVVLEPAVAYQDPPTPLPVPDSESGSAFAEEEAVCCEAIIEFPAEEEEGVQYDLEYAFVLGDDLDTAEMRVANSLWRSPREVIMLGSRGVTPHYRVLLPELRPFRGDPLKLALLQRVRFRLRARLPPEGSSSRWWSSVSPPVSTGFAGAENVTGSLVAGASGLSVEVHFQLDTRLAGIGSQKELQLQRAELFQVLDSETSHSKELGSTDAGTATASAIQPMTWPRGFGHPYATRYQLRKRHWLPLQSAWSVWEAFPDAALPKELPGGQSHSKWYKVSVPDLVATAQASSCEQVQASVRVGDGFRWSPWKACKEVPVLLEKPRAPEGAEALASWKKVCRIEWPLAIAHAGIQEVEYQLLVIPDSAHLMPFVGALVVAPAASEAAPMSPRGGPGGRKKGRKEGAVAGAGVPAAGSRNGYPQQGTGSGAGAPSAYLVAGQATLKPRREGEGEDGGAAVVLELAELCPELRYAFQVFARYPTVGPRVFQKIYQVEKISRSSSSEAVATLPLPAQVPFSSEESQEMMQRWLQDDSQLVLLTWDGLLPEAANPRQASLLSGSAESLNPPYEVQAAEAEAPETAEEDPQAEADPDPAEGEAAGAACGAGPARFVPCPVTKPFAFEGKACVAVRSLPFLAARFRLFDPSRMQAGPCTGPVVSLYEQLEPCRAEMLALPQRADAVPRSLAILLQVSFAGAGGQRSLTARLAGLMQLRFRRIGCVGATASWEELPAETFFREGPKVVREEDGLELGNVYEFQVRVGDVCRMGPWSKSSPPVRFALSPPVPCEGGGLRILEKGDRAEVSWAPFQPDAASQAQLPNLSRLPIEYTLSIFADDEGAASDSAETRRETRLVSSLSTTSTVCSVSNLRPLSAYSASLSARWSRFGNVESGSTAARAARLFAAFATTGLKGSKLTAELSVRLPAGSNDFHKVGAPTRASIPMEGTGVPAAVTLDLDPYYAQPRLNHYKPEFVRKPSLPSSRRTQAQDDSPEERPLSPKQPTLPRVLVPMPPPKFTTRDPLSFALLQPKPPRPTATPRSARGAASSSAFRAEQC